jgi:hypothetical protein
MTMDCGKLLWLKEVKTIWNLGKQLPRTCQKKKAYIVSISEGSELIIELGDLSVDQILCNICIILSLCYSWIQQYYFKML